MSPGSFSLYLRMPPDTKVSELDLRQDQVGNQFHFGYTCLQDSNIPQIFLTGHGALTLWQLNSMQPGHLHLA
jgi:hypothetical protein